MFYNPELNYILYLYSKIIRSNINRAYRASELNCLYEKEIKLKDKDEENFERDYY